jgi:hypothetical protein
MTIRAMVRSRETTPGNALIASDAEQQQDRS